MKKFSAVLVVVLSICLVASLALASHHIKKGAVKSVDAKAGSIVVTVDGRPNPPPRPVPSAGSV